MADTYDRKVVPTQGALCAMLRGGPNPEELELLVRFACRYVDQVNANLKIHAYYERCDVSEVVLRGNACNHGEP